MLIGIVSNWTRFSFNIQQSLRARLNPIIVRYTSYVGVIFDSHSICDIHRERTITSAISFDIHRKTRQVHPSIRLIPSQSSGGGQRRRSTAEKASPRWGCPPCRCKALLPRHHQTAAGSAHPPPSASQTASSPRRASRKPSNGVFILLFMYDIEGRGGERRGGGRREITTRHFRWSRYFCVLPTPGPPHTSHRRFLHVRYRRASTARPRGTL